MMGLFYYDEKIRIYESVLDYKSAIIYLEGLFEQSGKIQYLNTLIASAWYYFIEGGVNLAPPDYDDTFFLCIWKKYLELGNKDYRLDPEFCFVAGYTCYLHGFYVDEKSNHEERGLKFIKHCIDSTCNKTMKAIATSILDGPAKKRRVNVEARNNLFPSDSFIDKYFRAVV